MCWSCVSLRNGVEPDKERTAEEQTIAGGGAFTWIKEGLGLIPMCVRLKSTAWAAAERQEPAGQSRALSKPFESVTPSLSQEADALSILVDVAGCSMGMIGRCSDWVAGDAAGAPCSLWYKMSACFWRDDVWQALKCINKRLALRDKCYIKTEFMARFWAEEQWAFNECTQKKWELHF